MKNIMILTIIMLSCMITGLYAAAPGGVGGAQARSSAGTYEPSDEATRNLEDMWLFHSLMPDALAQQLAKDWLKAGRNPAPSIEEVAQHFGGEGRLFTRALLEKVRKNILVLAEMPIMVEPERKIIYQGDYRSFRNALIAYLNDALTKAGADHGVALNLSSSNLGGLVRDNPGQCVDLMHEIHATIDRHRCILTQLNLSDNGLTTLPENVFGQFDSLDGLSLSNNQLATLPPSIFAELSNLQLLSLDRNEFATLPVGVFAGLTNLQKLWLNNNQLATLPAGIFDGLTNLAFLSLYRNQLATLPSGIFGGLTKLQQLALTRNQFATLPPGLFADLTKLQALLLNENQLTTLPPGIFAGLTNLQKLWLTNNQLTTLPPDTFAGLANLKILSLIGNQLSPGVREAIRRELPATTKIEF